MSIDVRGGEEPANRHTHPLDNAVWAALAGPHAPVGERVGRAARYPADVYAYSALAGPSATVRIKSRASPRWLGGRRRWPGRPADRHRTAVRARREAVRLGLADVPEILELVARTRRAPSSPGLSDSAPISASGTGGA